MVDKISKKTLMNVFFAVTLILLFAVFVFATTAFSASVVLQILALKMSIRKMEYLKRIGIIDHGVHPDVPKNVSKSITVD